VAGQRKGGTNLVLFQLLMVLSCVLPEELSNELTVSPAISFLVIGQTLICVYGGLSLSAKWKLILA
jgi:hypothetical protein